MDGKGRVIAIGDIHGCAAALRGLLRLIDPQKNDLVVTLGDYINRGPDSRGVIDQLRELATQCQLVPLLGNHDELLLSNRSARTMPPDIIECDPENEHELFYDEHFDWLSSCRLYFETETHFFMHANYQADIDLSSQDPYTLLWVSLSRSMPKRHFSGKVAVVGHSSQKSGEILDLPHLKCIDTYCYGGGWLTALDVANSRVWQVNREGVAR